MTRTGTTRARSAVLAILAMAAGLALPVVSSAPAQAAATKTTICHATNSHSNPYRRISVAQSAVNRHGNHHGGGAVWSSGITTRWDDIVPDATAGGSNGSQKNWTTAGIAIYNSVTKTAGGVPACKGMTAKQYYDSEIAAGIPQAAVLADLNDQKANEDAALLASIGGSFTAANVAQLDAVKATTTATTAVGVTTATLTGSLTLGTDGVVASTAEQAALSFDYGTDPYLVGASNAAATPATATGSATTFVTTTTSRALTGLTAATTYYYRVVGVTDAGADTQATLQGQIMSFTTTGTTAQSLTFEAGANGMVGNAARTYTFGATASGNPVTITSANPAICSVAGLTVTLVSAGTCSLTASVAGNATYQAVSVTDSFLIAALTPQPLTFEAGLNAVLADPTRSYTFDPTPSGNPVTVASADPGVCSVSGLTVTIVAVGTCSLTASVAGDSTHAAGSASDSFLITAVPLLAQTLTFDAGVDVPIGSPARTYTFAPTESGNPVTLATANASICSVSGLTVTLVAAGTCSLTASVAGNTTYNPATASDSFLIAAAVPSTGVGTDVQYSPVLAPTGTLAIVNGAGNPVTTLPVTGGTYTVETDKISFTPELGFAGTAPAVVYAVTDNGVTTTASYAATVTAPAAPIVGNVTSSGVQGSAHSPTVALTAVLIDGGGADAADVVIAGQGTYALVNGALKFTGEACFIGQADPVSYKVIDPYGQRSNAATYTATATTGPAPAVANETSTGVGTAVQSVTVTAACGGTVHLVDGANAPVTTLTRAEGIYTVVPATGVIAFAPASGYSGTPAAVPFRVTTAPQQTRDATYTPTVTAPIVINPVTPPVTPVTPPVPVTPPAKPPVVPPVVDPPATVRDTPRAGLVKVPAVLPKDGGKPRETVNKTRSAKGIVAPMSDTLGKGGLRAGQATTLSGRFLFEFDSAKLTPKGVRLVKALVKNLKGTAAVTCEGYTDYAGDHNHELDLSRRRSVAVCSALVKFGAKVTYKTPGYAGGKPLIVAGRARERHEHRRVVVVVYR